MVSVEDYIGSIYVEYILSQEEYETITREKCYFDKGSDIYEFGLFYDSTDYYHVNILGGPEFLKRRLREIKPNKILK